jgi:hypothetical protein
MTTIDKIIHVADLCGYTLTELDAQEIINTSHKGETIRQALADFLNTYESSARSFIAASRRDPIARELVLQ